VLVHPARPWDLRPRDDEAVWPDPATWPDVCIVVPARNEAGVLPATLSSLAGQDYPGRRRIVVVDDRSTDGTAEVARSAGHGSVDVVDGTELPEGWAGKVWALEQGLVRAGEVDYLLLTDADIVHAASNLAELVAESEACGLALVSRMARLHVEGGAERLLVPAFVFFFALLYPMRWANDPRRRVAAAAGGCVLIRRDALQQIGGFAAIRGAVIDDVALAAAVKRLGLRVRLAVSVEKVRSVRSYRSVRGFWKTVRRTAFTQLRRSWLLVAATMVALALLFLAPPLLVAIGLGGAGLGIAGLGGGAWLAAALAYLPTVLVYRLSPVWALTLPLAGVLYAGMTVDSALSHARGRGGLW
jgi:hopene-associated glycosyltransferase HpnB